MRVDLSGYVIGEKIHENERIEVYKGYAVKDRRSLVIKVLKESVADFVEISRFLCEYEITRNLNVDGILSYVKVEQIGGTCALIMDDVGAVSLREYIYEHRVSLSEFLDIAIQLTTILSRLHQKGVIHRDLKPENIVINPNTKRIYIIDFSNAMYYLKESKNPPVINEPVGSLEYMAPEQTGRLNIGTDNRSDLYSLGIVFYEMLTGMLPLQAEDPAGWIYVHITQEPLPPKKYYADIPHVLSDIIMKLLQKAVEKRYQSAQGLLWDLKECKMQWAQTGRIDSFPMVGLMY